MTVKKHGVVVVSGQGADRQRGAFLAEVAGGVATTFEARGATVTRTFATLDGQASATLRASTSKARDDIHEYEFIEAFWDDAFPPPRAQAILWWFLRHARTQLRGTVRGWFSDPTNKGRGPHPSIDPDDTFFTGDPPIKINRAISVLLWIQLGSLWMLLAFAIVAAIPILLLLTLFRALAKIPILSLWGTWQRLTSWIFKLDPFLTEVMGDSKRYLDHGIWSASARQRVEQAAAKLIEDCDNETLTIVAHSAGCGVSLDALLSDRPIPNAIAERRKKDKENKKKPIKVLLVTLGSAINRYYLLSKDAKNGGVVFARRFAEEQIDQRLLGIDDAHAEADPEQFFWLDLYARLDPVPAGEVREEVLDSLGVPLRLVKRRGVINYDNPIDDHGGYFRNRELVLPQIIRAISGGSYPWLGRGQQIPEIGVTRRLNRLAAIQSFRLLMMVAGIAHIVALSVSSAWRATLTRLLDALNDGVAPIVESVPLLQAGWDGGDGDLALTVGRLLAIVAPIALLFVVQRWLRTLPFFAL